MNFNELNNKIYKGGLIPKIQPKFVKAIFCEKHSFLHQLTQSITTDSSLNYEFSIQENYKFSSCCVHQIVIFSFTKIVIQQTICLHSLGIIDVIMSASDQEYPLTNKHSS